MSLPSLRYSGISPLLRADTTSVMIFDFSSSFVLSTLPSNPSGPKPLSKLHSFSAAYTSSAVKIGLKIVTSYIVSCSTTISSSESTLKSTQRPFQYQLNCAIMSSHKTCCRLGTTTTQLTPPSLPWFLPRKDYEWFPWLKSID
jgi:hypothetical protein